MENKLTTLFRNKNKEILSVYFTAGYPSPQDMPAIASLLEASGVDFVEVGIPFSDPLADGPVIQESSMAALKNGMSLNQLFFQLKKFNKNLSLPIVLMGYLNPILQFGETKFLEECYHSGVSGLIIPDLPLEYFNSNWRKKCEELSISVIFLITPQTTEERIREIDTLSSGFIYMVSSNSLTGQNKDLTEKADYFKRVKKMNLKNPLMIGFGIHDKRTLSFAFEHANGAIIGSAFIQALKGNASLKENINSFIKSLK